MRGRLVALPLALPLPLALSLLAIVAVAACKKPKEAKVERVFVGPESVCVRLAGGEVRCAGKINGPSGFHAIPDFRGADGIALGAGGGTAVVGGQPHSFGSGARPPCITVNTQVQCAFGDFYATFDNAVEGVATSDRACALLPNGDVSCTRKGGAKDPPIAAVAKAIALSDLGLCILHAAGTLSCEDHGKLTPIQGVFGATDLSAAGKNACVVAGEKQAICWGTNEHAELGTPEPVPRDVPTPLFFRAE